MNTITNLKDHVELRSGYSFRGRIESSDDGEHRAIQLKDVDIEQGISYKELIQTTLPGRAPSMLVQNDDLLFVARGNKNYAICVQGVSSPMVASQHFIHIRIKSPKKLLPEYLAWYINYSLQAQKYFRQGAQGTALRSITRSMIEAMPLEVPSVKVQQKIIDLHQVHLHERTLLRKLLENNFKTHTALSNQLLNQ